MTSSCYDPLYHSADRPPYSTIAAVPLTISMSGPWTGSPVMAAWETSRILLTDDEADQGNALSSET